ncbi:MAG TPA: hypothetical protein VHQ45_19050, partial [Gemmatimonadaceae bacterium]|nr:hypothetical protein [Gemmatimonadaceae bacterium]
PDGVTAEVDADTLRATADGRAWRISTTMPAAPAVLSLRDRAYGRLLVLEPRPDSAPQVRLALPASDTTYQQVPRGHLELSATVSDDVGIDHGYFEYMLTAGGGENFETKTSTGQRVSFGHARAGVLRATLRFDTLAIAPGTVLHIRAVALDANDVSGPGRGVSETRTIRIAEPKDSIAVNPVPPLPIDSMWMSQRLLNMRTDTLARARAQLERTAFRNRSAGDGTAQAQLRQRVLRVISTLEADGVGGTFETETSTKLRQVADMMWTARMFLGVAQPDTALPVMGRILDILDEIRLAHRYYLRGVTPSSVVDIERVRLTGKGDAAVERRQPRARIHDPRRALAARLDAAASLLATSRQAGIDSLTVVRVAALGSAPEVGAALGQAIEALRRGAEARETLAPVRRALEPRPRIAPAGHDQGGAIP